MGYKFAPLFSLKTFPARWFRESHAETEDFSCVATSSSFLFREKILAYPADRGISGKPQEMVWPTTALRTNHSQKALLSLAPEPVMTAAAWAC